MSSKRGARVDQKAETRALLEKAALQCFAEKGYGATQVADVARRAGVAHGTFYVHFPTKADLVDHLLAQFQATMVARLERAWRLAHPDLAAVSSRVPLDPLPRVLSPALVSALGDRVRLRAALVETSRVASSRAPGCADVLLQSFIDQFLSREPSLLSFDELVLAARSQSSVSLDPLI